MAIEAGTLGTQRTIREYLNDILEEQIEDKPGVQLTITTSKTPVYEVDLLWSGQEYLIAYKENETATTYPIVRRLIDVLPIGFIEIPVPTTPAS